MLHSSLPRAFLPPEFNYLGYYSDEVHQHPCAPPTTWHIPMQSPPPAYARIPEHHALQSWDSSRSSTPCPLDLSLKPPPTPTTPSVKDIAVVAEDEKYRRAREEVRGQSEHGRYRKDSEEDPLVVDDLEALPTHDQLLSKKEPIPIQETPEKTHVLEEVTRLASFPSSEDIGSKYYPHDQKVLLGSPSHHLQSVQSYHQQLLLTPQYHLQGMQHAPMTPPSTPSPPQCPRRRVREEESSPLTSLSGGGGAASATSPRQSNSVDKGLQRPKKKHARRLKFDEDTSSPVSGTVILGPDEAVVTGDIDPAFNIVEVTEEARAELAKIENRLGPYQCKLCRQLHEDAFQLAQHRCSRIAHVEYRCPECDKRFSCPANLASHRRWHKPRLPNGEAGTAGSSIEIPCGKCEAKFTRQAAYRKHLATQHPENENNNVPMETREAIGKPDAVHLLADGPANPEMP